MLAHYLRNLNKRYYELCVVHWAVWEKEERKLEDIS